MKTNTWATLLEVLRERFPSRLPADRDISIEQVRYLQGQQSVLETIQTLLEIEEER